MASNGSIAVNESGAAVPEDQPKEESVQPAPEEQPTPVQPEPEEVEEDPADGAGQEDEVQEISWQASEYVHHEKTSMWYVAVGVITVILLGVAILTQQWFSIPVFVVMAVAVVVYSNKQPRMLNYHIGDNGITVGDKTYGFKQFRSFAVIDLFGVRSIDLDPTQRFQPRLSLMINEEDLDPIVDALATELPLEQRNPDVIERFSRYIKF